MCFIKTKLTLLTQLSPHFYRSIKDFMSEYVLFVKKGWETIPINFRVIATGFQRGEILEIIFYITDITFI